MMRGMVMAGALAATVLTSLPAQAQPHGQSCFYTNQWTGWKAPDDHTLLLNVGGNRVFRVDLAAPCPELELGSSRIISIYRGSSGQICSPLEMDIRVSQGDHIAISCIVRGLTELTPAEIAALPRHLRP